MTDFHFPYSKRRDREENLPSVFSPCIFPDSLASTNCTASLLSAWESTDCCWRQGGEINIHLFSPRSLFHPVGMGDLWMFRSFGVHFYSLPWWEDHRDTSKVVQVSHCWLNRHKRKSSGSLEEAREEDGRTGISLRLLACSEISFSTVRAHWGLHGKSASSLGSSMKGVFWHTLKSLFQAEILTSLIFTLCFNVAYIARKSDGEYGERNDGGFCLLFVVF